MTARGSAASCTTSPTRCCLPPSSSECPTWGSTPTGSNTPRRWHEDCSSRRSAETNPRLGSYRLLAEVLCDLGRVEDALQVLDGFRDEANAITPATQYGELAWVEARCLRLAGRVEEALAVARRDVRIVEASDDEHDLMLALEELAACEEAAGDLQSALADTREVKRHMWEIHQRQTRQLVQQVWARVDLERDRSNLQTQAAEATRSAEEDALTGIGNRRLLERFLREEAARQTEVACIIADVDSFKEINDTFGHDVGDAVLRQIGQLFSSKTRSGQLAIRYGGDEFVLALAGRQPGGRSRIRRATAARGLRPRLDDGRAGPPRHREPRSRLRSGEGLARSRSPPRTTRLLAAKRRGRNTVVTTSISALTA